MFENLTPGVYVQEMPSPPPSIEGVPTGTAALIGETERGPLRPRLVTGAADYARWFGGFCGNGRHVPAAVAGFFENGGSRLYIARVAGSGAATAELRVGPLVVEASGPGAWGGRVWTRLVADGGGAFRLQLAYWTEPPVPPFDPFAAPGQQPRPQAMEEHAGLSLDPDSANYVGRRLSDAAGRSVSPLARVRVEGAPPQDWGSSPGGFLEGGADAGGHAGVADFRGEPTSARAEPQGLAALAAPAFDDVALVCAPFPSRDPTLIARAVVEHCDERRFRFAVVDCDPAEEPLRLVPRDPAAGVGETTRAAFYAPWIYITDPAAAAPRAVPPGGHMLGVYARTDRERGVHVAPANQRVHGATNVTVEITHEEQDVLNPRGVNVIRRFPERGVIVWGARTLAADSEWKYVSVRRQLIFLERSIQEGTRWAAFEPNAEPLWTRIRAAIEQFLITQWRSGALQGHKADEAFFVKCDRTTMTQDDIDNGRLVCLVGVAPVRPAEFVIFRIGQKTERGVGGKERFLGS